MEGQLSTYQTMEITSKSQLDLILQVYDGAIDAFQSAHEYYRQKDHNSGFEQLERAKRFLTHLYTTLNHEEGGEIADQLAQLYVFLINQANMIQATKDLDRIDDNINILKNIRQGWQGLKDQEMERKPVGASAKPENGSGHFNQSV